MKKLLTVVTLVSALSLGGNEAYAWPQWVHKAAAAIRAKVHSKTQAAKDAKNIAQAFCEAEAIPLAIPTPPKTPPPPAEANENEPETNFTDAEVGPASSIVEELEIAADAQDNINLNMPFLAFDREKYHLRNTPNEAFDNLTMAMEMLIPKIEAWCTAKGLSFYLSQPSLAVIDHNPAIVFSAYFVIVLLNVSHEQCTQQLQAATQWLENYYAYPTSATAAIAVVSAPASAPSQNPVEQVSAQDAAADAFNIFLDEVKAAQPENEEFVTYLVIQALGDKIHQFLCTEHTPEMAQEFFSTIDARVLWWWIYNMAMQMILPDEINNAQSWADLLRQLQATTIQGFNLLAEFDKQIETLSTSTAYKDGRIIFETSQLPSVAQAQH